MAIVLIAEDEYLVRVGLRPCNMGSWIISIN